MSDKSKSIIVPVLGIGVFLGILYLLFREDQEKETAHHSAKKGGGAKKILVIGDSLTAGFGIEGQAFVDQLSAGHPELSIKRIAVTGKQTGWMLDQLKKELATGHKYDIIIIWGGINDIYATNSISGAKKNLQEMYDRSRNLGAQVIAINTIPTGSYKQATAQKLKLTNDLNEWISANPVKNILLDASSIVGDGSGSTKPEYMQSDKLHLTASAQTNIASKLYQLL